MTIEELENAIKTYVREHTELSVSVEFTTTRIMASVNVFVNAEQVKSLSEVLKKYPNGADLEDLYAECASLEERTVRLALLSAINQDTVRAYKGKYYNTEIYKKIVKID